MEEESDGESVYEEAFGKMLKLFTKWNWKNNRSSNPTRGERGHERQLLIEQSRLKGIVAASQVELDADESAN